MEERKQVLIIGAGASKPYGFPLGEELFNNVRSNYPKISQRYISEALGSPNYEGNMIFKNAKAFAEGLNDISGISLDKYINLNKAKKIEGVKAIAIEILNCEQRAKYPGDSAIQGDWLKYLFSKMINGLDTFDQIKRKFNSGLGIITFNYDRMIENYLFCNLFNILKSTGIHEREVAEIILTIPIIHVYGKTGYLGWEKEEGSSDIRYFGKTDKLLFDDVNKISHMIQLIYDERKNNDQISLAKRLIKEADRVLFLGFGYDELNLSILGFPQDHEAKRIIGTAYRSTENEREHIRQLISGGDGNRYNEISIVDEDCLMILRNYLLVRNA
jgi:hypothetical protein